MESSNYLFKPFLLLLLLLESSVKGRGSCFSKAEVGKGGAGEKEDKSGDQGRWKIPLSSFLLFSFCLLLSFPHTGGGGKRRSRRREDLKILRVKC